MYKRKKTIGQLIIILGIITGIMFFASGSKLKNTGNDMQQLISVSGTSLAESYYQEVGNISFGLGKFSSACGLGIITLSLGIGYSFIDSANKEQLEIFQENQCS